MNRLSPLIVRRVGPHAPPPAPEPVEAAGEADASVLLRDLKLFVTGWLGGLVFFFTFLS